jgi:uncharacterized protein YbjQ (UPF0145 family)
MNCPNCGKTVDNNASFCPYCGNNLKMASTGSSSSTGAMAPSANPQIILLTSNYAPGWKVDKVLGMTYGLTVRSRGLGGNLVAGLRTIGGGEIKEYTQLAHQARQEALDRLADHAKGMGANFGTAVVVSPIATDDRDFVRLS